MRPIRGVAVALLLFNLPTIGTGQEDHEPVTCDIPDEAAIPEGPLCRTGIIPVDQAQRDLLELANRTYTTGYDLISETLQPLETLLPDQRVILYRDGAGIDEANHDPATGVLGRWYELGDDVWTANSKAAHQGQWGFSSANRPDGTYALLNESLHVTPELDLRTGFRLGERAAPAKEPWTTASTAAGPQFLLEFYYRTNLGARDALGRDGVDLWILTEEGLASAVSTHLAGRTPRCEAGCLPAPESWILRNGGAVGYSYSNVEALGGPGFSGTQAWTHATLNLTPMAERRVWVAFHFASGEAPPSASYFGNDAFFENASFYGFQLDDLVLSGPAPPTNMQVHELGDPEPVLDWAQPIPVETYLRNTGQTTFNVNVTVQLLNRTAGNAPLNLGCYETGTFRSKCLLGPYSLQPGDAKRLRVEFSPLPWNASLTARAQGVVLGPDGRTVPDTDSNDDGAARDFQVFRLRKVQLLELARQSETWVPQGSTYNFTGTLTNIGTTAETVTVLARLVDLKNGRCTDASDLLSTEDRNRTFELDPRESRAVAWTVQGTQAGQYKLFLRTPDRPDFDCSEVVPAFQPPLTVPYFDGPVAVDGQLGEVAWKRAAQYSFAYAGSGPTREATVRVVHDGASLFLAANVTDASQDTAQEGDEDALAFYFDDLADGVLVDEEEDGVLVGGQVGLDLVEDDLAYDSATLWWTREGDAAGNVARSYDPVAQVYTYEIKRPMANTDSTGLMAGTGDSVGFYSELREMRPDGEGGAAPHSFHYPEAGLVRDGAGSAPANGQLDDEVATWARFRLAPPADASTPAGFRTLSVGFGVGMGPPLAYYMDTQEACPTWSSSGAVDIPGRGQDKWNCAFYRPEGRVLWYEGMSPQSTCGGIQCLPYSAVSNPQRNSGTVDAVLSTGPIDVPEGGQPTLLLRHQYATALEFDDAALPKDGSAATESVVVVFGIAWVTAQECTNRDPSGDCTAWGDDVYLVPDVGYSTEASELHEDGARSARDFLPALGPLGTFCDENLAPPPGKATPANCGWWSPVGELSGYRPAGARYPIGAVFERGSPWRLSSIPLYGNRADQVDGHGQYSSTHSVNLMGKTVRFNFHLAREDGYHEAADPLDPALHPARNLGWRIAALAVAEAAPIRDAGLEGLRVNATYDPEALGLGPGTSIPLEVTVQNVGKQELRGIEVRFEGVDVNSTGAPRSCGGTVPIQGFMGPDDRVIVQYACHLPSNSSGASIVFRASVDTASGDELPLNNEVSLRPLGVRASPDAAVRAEVSPLAASTNFARTVALTVQNTGNVPLNEPNGTRTLQLFISRNQLPPDVNRLWTLRGQIPVGQSWSLSDPRMQTTPPVSGTDGVFAPLNPGDYSLVARLGGTTNDANLSNDVAQLSFRALDTFYANNFQDPPAAPVAGVVLGQLAFEGTPVWQTRPDPESTGRVLMAGDPVTEQLPPRTNASAVLPKLDLSAASEASLVLRHEYAFEQGFDGARLEISADDGTTWETLRPREGNAGSYSPMALLGENPLLDGASQGFSSAFTGPSVDAGSGSGRVVSEFDLAQATSLQEGASFVQFDLRELGLTPGANVLDSRGDRYFFGEGWSPEGQSVLDGWLVENVTVNDPKPHSGSKMWWSGTTGEFTVDHVARVDTGLRVELDLTAPKGANESGVVGWYDWRAGWRDRELLGEREGTGGLFRLFAEDSAGDRTELSHIMLEREEGGWSKREADLAPFLGKRVTLEFSYSSLYRGREPNGDLQDDAARKNNEGWFLDDLSVIRFNITNGDRADVRPVMARNDLEGLVSAGCGGAGPFTVRREIDLGPNEDEPSASCWRLVERGTAREGAWHIENVTGPGDVPIRAWRLSTDDPQGYPNQANTRLITPPVDLTRVAGKSVHLHFDHRYDFEAEHHPGATVPGDAGVVEVQEFDEISNGYGPWRTLYAAPPGTHLGRPEEQVAIMGGLNDAVQEILTPAAFDATGYAALYDRGSYFGRPAKWFGVGSPFEPMAALCLDCKAQGPWEWSLHPISPAFSGNSQGWTRADWDVSQLVGKKVRFGFHAWTNPQDTTSPDFAFEGWSIANVALDGTVFQGKPVLVRLRAGTDGSLLDGRWAISDMEVSGVLYARKLAIEGPSGPQPQFFATTVPIEIPFGAKNQGLEIRPGLAVGVKARVLRTNASVGVELSGTTLSKVPTAHLADADVPDAWGPFALTRVGTSGAQLGASITLANVPAGEDVEVFVTLLEDRGDDVLVNGTLTHRPSFGPPRDDAAGFTEFAWRIRRADLAAPALRPAGPQSAAPVQVRVGDAGQVELRARVANDGSVGATFTSTWELWFGGEKVRTPAPRAVFLEPADATSLVELVHLDSPGVYKALLRVTSPIGPPLNYTIDFPFLSSSVLWREDFEGPNRSLPDLSWRRSGNDEAYQFRLVNGRLAWGVAPGGSGGYCDLMGECRSEDGNEGWAASGPIDVSEPTNARADLVLHHAAAFVKDQDGGRVEATPLDSDGLPRKCNGAEEWVPLLASEGFLNDARTASEPPLRTNPLGRGAQVFQSGGDTFSSLTTRIDLASQSPWCPTGESVPLLGSHISVRFRVGVQGSANAKPFASTAWGWRIEEAGIESARVRLSPTGDSGEFELPLMRLVPKAFPFIVANDGPTWKSITAAIDALGPWACLSSEPSADESCVKSLNLDVPPGASRRVWLKVRVGDDTPVSPFTLGVRTSEAGNLDPLRDALVMYPKILGLSKPNLAVTLTVDDPQGIEAGEVVPVHASVTNSGQRASKPVAITFLARDNATGQQVPVETLTLPSLCAPRIVGCSSTDAHALVTAEWPAPTPGPYVLKAVIDPEEINVETTRHDNVFELPVTVIPPQLPDLKLADLVAEGVGPQGFVEEGSLLRIKATVQNVGEVPVAGAQVRIFSGSVTLSESDLPLLAKNATHQVTAFKVAAAPADGQIVLRSIVISPGAQESKIDNNELRRVLTVRRHNLTLDGPSTRVTLQPGETTTATLRVRNDGNTVERTEFRATAVPPKWQVQVLPGAIAVPPGGVAMAVAMVSPPPDALGGNHSILITGDAGVGKANVTLPFQVAKLTAPAKLSLEDAKIPAGSSNLTFVIQSASNVPQEADLEMTGVGPVTIAPSRVHLEPYEVNTIRIPATTAPSEAPGRTRLSVSLRAVEDAWTTTKTFDVQILPSVRARAAGIEVLSSSIPGDGSHAVVLELNMTNQGNVPINVSAREDVGPALQSRGEEPLRLEPGAAGKLRISVAFNESQPWSNSSIVLLLQASDQEVSELYVPLAGVGAGADLQILSWAPLNRLRARAPITIGFVVHNAGWATSLPSDVHVFVDQALAASVPVPSLRPGEHYSGAATIIAPPGQHVLTVLADGGQAIVEGHEDDNGRSQVLEWHAGNWVNSAVADHGSTVAGASFAVLAAAISAALFLWRPRRKP